MKLTTPLYRLKHKAKKLARDAGIPLHVALDQMAKEQGYTSWSLLASQAMKDYPSAPLYPKLKPGELVLLGARPGHGKTRMGLELIADALKAGHKGFFYTLEYNEADVLKHLQQVGGETPGLENRFHFDCSDSICAAYMIDQLGTPEAGSLVVIDYLQLLDQKRDHPDLKDQISALKTFARETGLIIVCISQIDRSYELSGRSIPGLADVRLPNPLDLTLFNKACFLHEGKMRIEALGGSVSNL